VSVNVARAFGVRANCLSLVGELCRRRDGCVVGQTGSGRSSKIPPEKKCSRARVLRYGTSGTKGAVPPLAWTPMQTLRGRQSASSTRRACAPIITSVSLGLTIEVVKHCNRRSGASNSSIGMRGVDCDDQFPPVRYENAWSGRYWLHKWFDGNDFGSLALF